jgi:phosphate butyryltransferase
VEFIVKGEADIIMKGLLHTSTFLKSVLNKENGLNAGRLISQISVFDKEFGEGLQLLTDCAMAIQPNLDEKKQIIENAVSLARKIGYKKPRVALLSALEIINPTIQDTVEAAILSKMGDRDQIKNAVIDGPFALDNAISLEAAEHKGIKSEVAGKADILVAPNLQVGNVLTKALTYYAHKDVAAAVMGAKIPIIMTSRTDMIKNKLLSVALASYIS